MFLVSDICWPSFCPFPFPVHWIVELEFLCSILRIFILGNTLVWLKFCRSTYIWKNFVKGWLAAVLIILLFKISLLRLFCSCKYKRLVNLDINVQKIWFLHWLISKLYIEMSTVAQLASSPFKKNLWIYCV